MPLNPIRNFECDDKPIINYYIKGLNRMKNDAYKYPIYSHLGVYIPEIDFSWYVTFNNINDKLWWIY